MKMPHFSTAILLIGLLLCPLCGVADDGKPGNIPKHQSSREINGPAKKSPTSSTPDGLKAVLHDALKLVQSIEKHDSDQEKHAVAPPVSPFDVALSKELQAGALKAIGRAQAKLGDLAGAHSTWQLALEMIPQVQSYNLTEQAALYVEIAQAQHEARDQTELRFTLRQALQSTRAIKPDSSAFGAPPLPVAEYVGAEYSYDPAIRKIGLLCRIGQIQAEIGETTAAKETFRLADETACSIVEAPKKVCALLEITNNCPADKTKAVWAQVLDCALGIKAEYPRAKCVEIVLRARIKAFPVNEALDTVVDRLKGDLQSYAIWVVADAVASGEQEVAPATMTRLDQLARKATFDRPSKKLNVFKRIAEAHARLGDYDGAYRIAGEPNAANDIDEFRATQARVHVMKAVANAQLKAKERDAARDTVLAALELAGGGLADEDAEAYFPLEELGSIQARSGDPAGAERTVNALTSIPWRIHILSEIAKAHAQAGRNDLAHKAILRALDDARRTPNAAIWSRTDQDIGPFVPALDIDPMLPVLQTIAAAQAAIGDLDAALETVKDMGESSSAYGSRDAAIKQIAEARLEAGDFPGALKAVDLIADSDPFSTWRNDLLELIARKQTEQFDPGRVLDWVGKQKAPNAKLQAMRGLADGIVDRIAHQDSKPTGDPSQTKPVK
jgi:tetratricopeptide (TPR) repeat protein